MRHHNFHWVRDVVVEEEEIYFSRQKTYNCLLKKTSHGHVTYKKKKKIIHSHYVFICPYTQQLCTYIHKCISLYTTKKIFITRVRPMTALV